MKKIIVLCSMLLLTSLLTIACNQSTTDTQTDESTDNNRDVFKIAIDSPPPTLDQPASTATSVRDISRLIFETLITTNDQHEPVPMLAESIDTTDNQTYTFHLRKGIQFHNGEEMIAEDVITSMERWLEKSQVTGNLFKDATWEAEDDYTVILTLAQASPLALDTLATSKQSPAIMPKDIIDNAPAEGVEEYIGTGPYQFVEWKQDQYIHFTRFDDYQSIDMESDGLAGEKEANVKDIYVYIVTDSATRLAGLQSGEYDFIFRVPFDAYDQIQQDDQLDSILHPSSNAFLGLNKAEGLASNFQMREVINTALNNQEIMFSGFPHEDFFWLDSGYMDANNAVWASTAGSEYYNQSDQEKAKQLLEEMDYNGEEFKIITTRETDFLYNMAVVIHEQLKEIGIESTLEVFDTATMYEITDNEPAEWDAFVSASSAVSTPPQLIALSATWAGGTNDPYIQETMTTLEHSSSLEDAQTLWDELQLYVWEDVLPIIQLGGYNNLHGINAKVSGITANSSGPIFWNVNIAE